MASERNSLGGRVKRYARVSTAVGGFAARLAGERFLGIELDRGAHAAELRRALGSLDRSVAELIANGNANRVFFSADLAAR